jgi:hypothetical protein
MTEIRDIKEYVDLATVTEAPPGPVLERIKKNPEMFELFVKELRVTILQIEKLDLWKKALFYGKDYGPALKTKKTLCDKICDFIKYSVFRNKKEQLVLPDEHLVRILHGSVGIATESSELLEPLVVYFSGKAPFDMVNCKEEMADVGWYLNVMYHATRTNANESFELWYQKLKLRYGTKFEEHTANNRNLAAERKLLEENT